LHWGPLKEERPPSARGLRERGKRKKKRKQGAPLDPSTFPGVERKKREKKRTRSLPAGGKGGGTLQLQRGKKREEEKLPILFYGKSKKRGREFLNSTLDSSGRKA